VCKLSVLPLDCRNGHSGTSALPTVTTRWIADSIGTYSDKMILLTTDQFAGLLHRTVLTVDQDHS
jgi:hypothetical protein